ncbi:MAG: PAS domain-containing protein, partial [Solirubrobacterales bacterium]|nr:PAS domain-containing protein [Solirubrobacterales bacterium]
MARRVRSYNWAATPLGPVERWPLSLRTALSMVIDHPLPMVLAWGPELITLYNDAYRPLLGDKPEALGRPFLEVWKEAGDIIAPQIAQVLAGQALRFENAPFMLVRDASPEKAFFNYSYSPVRDETGAIAGVLNAAVETTERVSAERERTKAIEALRSSEERKAFLLALGDAMRAQSSANAMIEVAARLLGERLNASRIMFAEFDGARGIADIFHGWFADGAKPFPAAMRLEDYDGPILKALGAGRTVRIEDAGEPPFERPDLAAIAELGVRALLSVPLIVGGRLVANLSVHQHAARHWTDDEVALVQEIAERLWEHLVRARTEAALRASEARFRQFGNASSDVLWIRDAETLRWEYLTPAFERIYGVGRERALSGDDLANWAELIVPEDREHALGSIRRVLAGERVVFEYRIRRPSDG